MSALTKRYLPTLKKINRLAEKQKHQMIKNCDRQLVDCFSECAKNILIRLSLKSCDATKHISEHLQRNVPLCV